MGSHDGSQHVMRVLHPAGPLPHRLVDRVLQGLGAAGHRVDFGPQQLHAVHVQGLPVRVLLSHKDLTLHAHKGRHGGGSYPVLAGSRLGDDPGLSHLFCQQHLAQDIVDLVGACVVQILPLQINFCPSQIPSHLLRIIKKRRPSRVVSQQFFQLPAEFRVFPVILVGLFQTDDLVHESFRNILASERSKSSFRHF